MTIERRNVGKRLSDLVIYAPPPGGRIVRQGHIPSSRCRTNATKFGNAEGEPVMPFAVIGETAKMTRVCAARACGS